MVQVASSWWKKLIIVTYLNRPLAFESLPLPVGGAYKSWLELSLRTINKHGERQKRRVMTVVFLELINRCLKAKRCGLKNTHNLKVEGYILFNGNVWDFKSRRQHLKQPWENCSEEGRGGARLYRSFATKGR